MNNIEVPAVSIVLRSRIPVIQNGDDGSTSSRPGERGSSEGALTAIVWWRRRADLFKRKLVCGCCDRGPLSLTFRLTSVRVYGRTKNRSLVLVARRELLRILRSVLNLYANDGELRFQFEIISYKI